jgi:CheY-like chemotaxis protein
LPRKDPFASEREQGVAHLLISTPEQQAQRFLTLQLVFAGYSVAETENLEQTLEFLRTTTYPFDLLLLDICHLIWYGPVVLQALKNVAAEGPSGIIPTIRFFSPRSSKEHWLDLLPAESQALDLYPPVKLVQEIERALYTTWEPHVVVMEECLQASSERAAMTMEPVSARTAERS